MSLVKNEKMIKRRIQKAFEDAEYSESEAYDISFHMTDWLEDIDELVRVYSNIENLSHEEIQSFVYKFAAHVPNHLNATMKLTGMGPVTDVFELGIFDDE